LTRSESTATEFTGTYTVAAEDTDVADLAVASYVIGTAVDGANNALVADTDIAGFADLGSVVVDKIAPTLTGFSASPASGFKKAGDTIALTATASEDMAAGTSLTVTLNSGAVVTLTRNSSTVTEFTGTYTVGSGDAEVADLAVASYSIGTAVDLTGLALASGTDITTFSDLGEIAIDLTPPKLVSFSATPNAGTSGDGDQIALTATFDENMQAEKTINIRLNSGAIVTLTRDAESDTSFIGTYIVAADDNDIADLAVVSYTVGTAVDRAGNTLEAGARISGFGDLGDVQIDTSSPSIDIYGLIATELNNFPVNFIETKAPNLSTFSQAFDFELIDPSTLADDDPYFGYGYNRYTWTDDGTVTGTARVWTGDLSNLTNVTNLYLSTDIAETYRISAYDNNQLGVGVEIHEAEDVSGSWMSTISGRSGYEWFSEEVITALGSEEADIVSLETGFWVQDADRDGQDDGYGHLLEFFGADQDADGSFDRLGAAQYDDLNSIIHIYDEEYNFVLDIV
ncbi:hypothetical protein N9D70_01420, partial [bacterium]|nr:hypothetical protein [bacterium]